MLCARPEPVAAASGADDGRPETTTGAVGRRRASGRSRTPLVVAKDYFAAALSLEPAETLAAFVAAIWIVAPVCGFRPVRADR